MATLLKGGRSAVLADIFPVLEECGELKALGRVEINDTALLSASTDDRMLAEADLIARIEALVEENVVPKDMGGLAVYAATHFG